MIQFKLKVLNRGCNFNPFLFKPSILIKQEMKSCILILPSILNSKFSNNFELSFEIMYENNYFAYNSPFKSIYCILIRICLKSSNSSSSLSQIFLIYLSMFDFNFSLEFYDKYQYLSLFGGLRYTFAHASSSIHSTESIFFGSYLNDSSNLGGDTFES